MHTLRPLRRIIDLLTTNQEILLPLFLVMFYLFYNAKRNVGGEKSLPSDKE